MTRIRIVTLAFILLLSGSCSARKADNVRAIAFYNFENLFDTEDDPYNRGDDEFLPNGPLRYTKSIYQQKLHNLATVLKQLGTDVSPDGPAIIGAAEIENDRVLQDLVNQPEIKARNYKFIHFDSPDTRGIDVALLYNPKYFRPLSASALKDIGKHRRRLSRSRDVLYVRGILAGDTVHIFVNHWPSRRSGEAESASLRAIAAGISKKVIDSLMARNPRTKAIIMGDLNDDPTDYSVTKVLGARGDKNSVVMTGIFNPFFNLYKKGIGASGFGDSWNLFDQIMLTGAFVHPGNKGLQFDRAEVFNRDFLKMKFGRYRGYPHRSFSGNRWMNGYSDHFPTLVYLVKSGQ